MFPPHFSVFARAKLDDCKYPFPFGPSFTGLQAIRSGHSDTE